MSAKHFHAKQVGTTKPRFAKTQSFKELQALWYSKLKTDGFVDIEGGRDLNKIDASTLPGDRFAFFADDDANTSEDPNAAIDSVEKMMAANAEVFGTYTNLANTPTAIAWQNISNAANRLPPNYKRRGFLIDVAQVGCAASYLLRRHKLTQRQAIWAFNKFLKEQGMQKYQNLLTPGDVKEPK